jgi:8-amino-7-oxononanoate synthase
MTDGRLSRYEAILRGLDRKSRARSLEGRAGHDFASNDYLGLAASPRLAAAVEEALARGVPVGAAGSRLLRGNHPEHEALEAEAAAFFGADRSLYLGSGYAANVALLSALPQRGDLVVYDELIHASAHEGMALTKADTLSVPHNEAGAVAEAIGRWRAAGGKGTPWIAVESVYSMDGDRAPLADLAGITESSGGFLIVDEAHATGVLGPSGRGLAAPWEGREWLIGLHTCGKALGTSGALVTAHRTLIDFLVNRARPFIYATAPSPAIAAATRDALRILADEPGRRAAHADLVASTNRLVETRLGVAASGSHILPVILGGNARATAVAARMRQAGFDVRAVRPPTVPEGTARLRISLTLNVNTATVEAMVDCLAAALVEVPA